MLKKIFILIILSLIISTTFIKNHTKKLDDEIFSIKENISFDGKIATVKTSKKFRNVEACQKLCESRNSCAAFVLNTKAGSCTILKSVTDEDAKDGVTSGSKS